MITEHVHKGVRYTLSNENLAVGDKVFPIAWGRCLDGGGWIFHNFNYSPWSSSFPDDPHTIVNLHHDDYKPYEVRTDRGYSPRECYYKIIKREAQFDVSRKGSMFARWEWQEITEDQVRQAEIDHDFKNIVPKRKKQTV